MTDTATARSEATGAQRAMANHAHHTPHGQELAALSLAALGVVYGDIGTSPLYAMSECLSSSPLKPHAIAPVADGRYDPSQVLGVLSLFFWALDRKSTRLNSSHLGISYAVFCLKKK